MIRNLRQILPIEKALLFSWNTDNLNQIIRSGNQIDFGGLIFREESNKMNIKLILLKIFVFSCSVCSLASFLDSARSLAF